MFYSLVQTIVCVLLIQAGIYALHLNGPSGSSNGASLGSGGSGSGVGVNAPTSHGGSGAAQLNAAVNTNQMLNILSANQHAQHLHAGGSGSGSGGGGGGSGIGLSRALSKSAVNPLGNAGRLSQELADRAQLERERLMLLGLAKQTALANSGTGHHGRPIITGRIQMSPVEDVESDYTSLLLPQARGPLYGSVVKEPAAIEDDEYVDEERDYERARLSSGGNRKYEYGRIVEPADREEYTEPQHNDELDELIEAEPELDDVLSDLESYQYLDELLPPEHRNLWGDDGLGYGIAGGNSRPHHLNDGFPLLLNPYRTLEELENSPSHTLQEIFEKESHDKADSKAHRLHTSHPTHEQQQQYEQQPHHQPTQSQQQYAFSGGVKHRNGGYGGGGGGGSAADYNNNMQQKWQRKRSQQQQQQRQLQQWQRNIFGQQLKQQQLHHFGKQPQRHNKLSLANSEATATKHIPLNGSINNLNNNNNNNNKLSSTLNALATQQQSSSAPIMSSDDAAMKSDQLQQQQRPQQQQQPEEPTQQQVGKDTTADDASPTSGLSKAAAKLKAQQQQQLHKKQQTPSQKQESFLHPNHKRSGSVGGVSAANGMSAAAAAAATNGYSSIASQLMLRTARGQRQYDVPQIGE